MYFKVVIIEINVSCIVHVINLVCSVQFRGVLAMSF